MKAFLFLTWKSIRSRKFTVGLAILSIALSTALLLGVQRIRTQSHSGFINTISGTDLVVGARSGPVQLLLYSVFHIGNATNNLDWKSYQNIKKRPGVVWTIPISLGDSHKGYRVVGTNQEFFQKYLYADSLPLQFAGGKPFDDLFDVVLGAEVARSLGYELGRKIVLAHGAGKVALIKHSNTPFTVSGILKPTGTPIDRSLFISLEGITAIHVGWKNGVPSRHAVPTELTRHLNLTPKEITAFFVKLDSPLAIFRMQRTINTYQGEALSAILPGATLQELWQVTGMAERALLLIAIFVVVVGLVGMLTTLLASLSERRREMAILRSVGAGPRHIFSLLMCEAVMVTTLGIIIGLALLNVMMAALQPVIMEQFGIALAAGTLSLQELGLAGLIWLGGLVVGIIPAVRMYWFSLQDGLAIRF